MNQRSFDWTTFSDDEEVLWWDNPREKAVLRIIPVLPIAIILAAAIDMVLTPVGLIVGVGIIGWYYYNLKNTEYVLTNKRLYTKSGVLSVNTLSAGLEKIQNTSLSKGIIGNKYGFGSVSITTASSGNISVSNISNPQELRTLLGDQLAEVKQSPDRTESPTDEVDETVTELIEELERFRANIENFNGGTDE